MFISADGDISATVLGMLLLQLSARLSLKGDFDARRSTGLAAALLHGASKGATAPSWNRLRNADEIGLPESSHSVERF